MLVLLYLLVNDYFALEIAKSRATEAIYTLSIRLSLWAFIIGVLMEWGGVKNLFKKKFDFKWQLIIPSIVLTIMILIPNVYWLKWYGGPSPTLEHFIFNIFFLTETHMILSVLAGTIFIRSLAKR